MKTYGDLTSAEVDRIVSHPRFLEFVSGAEKNMATVMASLETVMASLESVVGVDPDFPFMEENVAREVAKETERCAEIAKSCGGLVGDQWDEACEYIAAKIRGAK